MAQALTLSRPLGGDRPHGGAAQAARGRAVARLSARDDRALACSALVARRGLGIAVGTAPNRAEAAPPAPPPLLDARHRAGSRRSRSMRKFRLRRGPIRRPLPFKFKGDKAARGQALKCLASAVYYEAGSQDDDGERAVAQVVLNRVRHPAFPGTRVRSRLSRVDPRHRLPVHLHLRRLALSPAGCRRLAPRLRDRRKPRSAAPSMRRSAGRPIITPIMSFLTGPRAWPRTPSSAPTSSTIGRANGVSRRSSPRPMPAASPMRSGCATPR